MPKTLQVIYPVGADTTFDYDYYTATHIPLVQEHMGGHIDQTLITKGLSGGPDTPAGVYAVATMVFADQGAMDAAMVMAGPVMADVRNFTNVKPTILIGEVIG